MIARRATAIIVLGLLLVLTGALRAQDQAQARAALEQTDNLIEYAGPLVHSANDALAIKSFDRGVELQAKAWDFFNKGNQIGYNQAVRFTQMARELVQAALTNSRPNETQDGTVQARLERAENRLDQAQQAMANEELARLESLYSAARNNLDRAWEFYRAEKYRPALKLADQVEKTARMIIDAANSADRLQDQFDRRSGAVSDLVAQANDGAATCPSADGKSAAEMASKAYDLAQQLSTSGKPLQAVKELQNARDLAQKSIRLCGGSSVDSLRLQGRFEQLKAEMDRLSEKAQGMTGDQADQARALLQQAQDLLAKAKSEIENGKQANAEATLQAAHLAISKARDYIDAAR